MPDYEKPVQFGYFLILEADPSRPLHLAAVAEELGLDLVGVQDHPYQSRFFDTWTLLTAIAMRTSRISGFPDVTSLPLRPPAVLAKAAASLDVLSGGRVELGLGGGAFWDAIVAMGPPANWRRVRARTGGGDPGHPPVVVHRALHSLRRPVLPARRRPPRAAACPPDRDLARRSRAPALALTRRLADGWVPPALGYTQPRDLVPMNARIDEAAQAAGRDPATIRRIYNLPGRISDGPAGGLLQGSVNDWAESAGVVDLDYGMDTFLLAAQDDDVEGQLRRFALEVVPRTRELVDQARKALHPQR